MTNIRYYLTKCGECKRAVERVYITKVSFNEGRRRFLPLCEECRKKYE